MGPAKIRLWSEDVRGLGGDMSRQKPKIMLTCARRSFSRRFLRMRVFPYKSARCLRSSGGLDIKSSSTCYTGIDNDGASCGSRGPSWNLCPRLRKGQAAPGSIGYPLKTGLQQTALRVSFLLEGSGRCIAHRRHFKTPSFSYWPAFRNSLAKCPHASKGPCFTCIIRATTFSEKCG